MRGPEDKSLSPQVKRRDSGSSRIVNMVNNNLGSVEKFVSNFFRPSARRRAGSNNPQNGQNASPSTSPPSTSINTSWQLLRGSNDDMDLTKSITSIQIPTTSEEEEQRLSNFLEVLAAPVVDTDLLRKMSWDGIPTQVRPICWQLLLGYLPSDSACRMDALEYKRKEYEKLITHYYVEQEMSKDDIEMLQQIKIDLPRTIPKGLSDQILRDERIEKILERVLFIWSKENAAVSYFQGLSDVLCHLVVVLLSWHLDIQHYECSFLSKQVAADIEADSFWCFNIMLDGMKDYYTSNLQVGMEFMMSKLKSLIRLIDEPLSRHLENESVEFIHFSLRWMLCLLTREFNVTTLARLWDTYISEGLLSYPNFHIYVCAAFMEGYHSKLMQMDFSEIIMFLQHLPTDSWKAKEADQLIKKALAIKKTEQVFMDLCMVGAVVALVVVLVLLIMLAIATLFSLSLQQVQL